MTSTAKPAPTIHTLEQAKTLAEQGIALLLEHGVPPSPLSYTVVYEYFSSNAPIQRAIDQHLQAGKALDVMLLRDLYEQHIISDHSRQLHGMGSNLQNILSTLMQSISEAGDGAATFGQNLEKNIGHLHTEIGPDDLQVVVADILSATQTAKEKNQHLQQRLEITLAETENLKGELEQYRREATVDPLTGLFNRRAMDAHLEELMTSEAGNTMSVIMVDIDHFKKINDTYGHPLGDVVIRNVAQTILKCIRGDDIAVRFGGEEFVVLLPDTTLDGATKVAETIRSRIAALRLVRRHDNFRLDPFTVSLGVATRKPEDSQDSLFQRADQALYQSKNAGRNRVSVEGLLH